MTAKQNQMSKESPLGVLDTVQGLGPGEREARGKPFRTDRTHVFIFQHALSSTVCPAWFSVLAAQQ